MSESQLDALRSDFDIRRQLGEGSMATVYLAVEHDLGRQVAIKVLKPGRVADETARKRFEREARAAASLVHRNVVPVYRFGRLADETPYLVMRYVKGRTMEERLAAEGTLPPDLGRRQGRGQAATAGCRRYTRAGNGADIPRRIYRAPGGSA